MDTLRTQRPPKIPIKASPVSNIKMTQPHSSERQSTKDVQFSKYLMHKDLNLNEDEKKTLIELKKLYMETITVDVELQQEIHKLEKLFEAKYNEIFDKRKKILEEVRRKVHGDSAKQPNMVNFWLKVLKASYTELISKRDEKILANLIDIRSKFSNDPVVKFVIEFHFTPNDYFSNRVLTKAYYLNCLPDMEEPLSYDGAEICKSEGCKIDWKDNTNKKTKAKKEFASFFDFFTPPKLPADPEDSSFYDINNDFELGFYLKERVIPKAVLFFTGEIAECQSSDSETDDSDEDDGDDDDDKDDDDEDDDEDDDDDDEGKLSMSNDAGGKE